MSHILGSKITFVAILGPKRALEMSYIRIRAQGICALKQELNYPFKL